MLVVSQFTLAADTELLVCDQAFLAGLAPDRGAICYGRTRCRQQAITHVGRFAADMQVELVNDGPVTFWLGMSQLPAWPRITRESTAMYHLRVPQTEGRTLLPVFAGNAA